MSGEIRNENTDVCFTLEVETPTILDRGNNLETLIDENTAAASRIHTYNSHSYGLLVNPGFKR